MTRRAAWDEAVRPERNLLLAARIILTSDSDAAEQDRWLRFIFYMNPMMLERVVARFNAIDAVRGPLA